MAAARERKRGGAVERRDLVAVRAVDVAARAGNGARPGAVLFSGGWSGRGAFVALWG